MKRPAIAVQWLLACAFVLCSLWAGEVGAVTLDITADAANSSTAHYSTSVANLLTDGFAYDEENPTSALPNLNYSSGFHGNEAGGGDVLLSFTVDSPFTTAGSATSVVVDVWGRNANQNRDDDFDVVLYNGDYSTVVGDALGVAVPDGASPYVRATINLAAGVTFDRFRILGHNSSGQANNPFTLTEVRMAMPIGDYVYVGGGGDNDWSNTVNWVNGEIPVDNATGSSGLNLPVGEEIVLTATTVPTNHPEIGGNTGNKNSPPITVERGGTINFLVNSTHQKSYLSEGASLIDILTVGDGVGGGAEDATVNVTLGNGSEAFLQRHNNNITHNFTVYSDGTLNMSTDSGTRLDFSYASDPDRLATFTVAGGDVVINTTLGRFKAVAGNHVSFTESGGSFMADIGDDFGNMGDVALNLGNKFLNNTGIGNTLKVVYTNSSAFHITEGYLWTGTAGDNDWNNTANWHGGQIPVDTLAGTGNNAGLTRHAGEVIEFAGSNMPSGSIQLGGTHDNQNGGNARGWDTPSMAFNSGGTINLSVVGREDQIWTAAANQTRTVFEVGDGVGGGTEDVTVNLVLNTELNRHNNGHHDFTVNSDGTLNITPNGAYLRVGRSASRTAGFTIDGGTVVVNDPIFEFANYAACTVDFTAANGAFTANYGNDFADIAAVEASLGDDFIDSTGVAEITLRAIDNGTSFTVVARRDQGSLIRIN